MVNRYAFVRKQYIPRPLEEVFAFFAKPENLSLLTPRELGFQIITPSPIEMRRGALIDYTIRLFGLRKRWTTRITSFHPPYQFVDEQLRGPYASWHHTHLFTASGQGTLITDTIEYSLAYGWLGEAAHNLVVQKQLEGIFRYRELAIERIFGTVPVSPLPFGKAVKPL
jgi:ligand-binding SRPBCC domain-containing protein